jgi:hypothetical protein
VPEKVELGKSMGRVYICPFCDLEKESKKQMDFHLRYGHADLYPLIREEKTKEQVEEKLMRLKEQKNLLEKEIQLMQAIIEEKQE